MFPILLRIGPVTLHTYGLLVALGFLTAFAVARVTFRREGWPIEMLDSLVFYLMFAALIGARLFYFGVDGFVDLRHDIWSFFRIWEGGLVFFGGVIGGLIALVIYARTQGLPILLLTDALAPPLLIGHAIGRLGCFAAGCCYGKATELPWGVTFTNPESLAPKYIRLHPTQIYESAGDLVLFAIAMWLWRRRVPRGVITVYYLLSYSLFRFLLEFIRGDDRGAFVHGFSPSQWISIAAMAVGLGIVVYVRQRRRA